MFPSPPGADLLQYTTTDNADLEVLPVANSDGCVVIMVANHAVNQAPDNNGPGAQRTVVVDVSALSAFSTGSLLTIDAHTNVASGPSETAVTPSTQIMISLDGYGVAFLSLKP